jgi:rubrerythrin
MVVRDLGEERLRRRLWVGLGRNNMVKKKDGITKGEAAAAAAAGVVIGGLFGYAITKFMSKQKNMFKCPNCGNLIEERASFCPKCFASLRWD